MNGGIAASRPTSYAPAGDTRTARGVAPPDTIPP